MYLKTGDSSGFFMLKSIDFKGFGFSFYNFMEIMMP